MRVRVGAFRYRAGVIVRTMWGWPMVRTGRVAALCGAVALCGALAGCGGGGGDEKPAAASSVAPSPSRTVDPDAAEKRAVLEAYEGMSEAEVRTYAKGKPDPELEKYAAHKALADIRTTAFWHERDGTVMRGEPKRSPEVKWVSTAKDPYKAEIRDCVDSSGYVEVYAKSGKEREVASPGPRRHLVVSTAQRPKAGGPEAWVIVTSTIERGRTC